jgi:hypothetical protein
MEGLISTVSNTQKALNTVATNTSSALSTVATNTQVAANNLFKSIPGINSMNRVRPNSAQYNFNNLFKNTGKSLTSVAGNLGEAVTSTVANVGETATSAIENVWNNVNSIATNVTTPSKSGWSNILMLFIGFIVAFLAVFSIYSKEIKVGWDTLVEKVKALIDWGLHWGKIEPTNEITATPIAPQDTIQPPTPPVEKIVESVLPVKGLGGGKQVFNVEANNYTYYDAEPLCKSLGAELATYDQVKEAWDKGADWCNYGWVKGQMAIYPTQKGTYEKLQRGPAEQRGACGKAGINGGSFDNPEMRFGVNCYGNKPAQDDESAMRITHEGAIPKTIDYIEFDKKVAEFKKDPQSDDVMPFNSEKWSQA